MTAAIAPQTIDDFFFALYVAAELGSFEMRETRRTKICRECGERVPVVEDKVAIRTSYGEAKTWRPRIAETHSRECFLAHRDKQTARTAQLIADGFDPWAR